ncbi:MAG: Bro-N domain-containing protein [Candidatus Cryptobacteroides sp.]|nr:Bro-N domain-containing protein [Bacteroidales bacterium]MDD7133338.1 Bro-N domain-containing protein [Bacteroidales bacterium]MDY2773416.1 Bro-N domain-containing protein [Candidatus Cryptobacteroides sp.]
MPQEIQLFADKQIRTYWDDDKELYFFCIIDVVEALTDSNDPKQYIKRMRQRDLGLNSVWGTICTPHQFLSSDGKRHQVNCASLGGVLRIIQSIPSPKAEPFKRWLAQVGADRLHQMQDPELGIQQSLADFKRLGYSDNWINQRLKSIEIRKDLTDQWKAHGVDEGTGYSTLTDIIYQSWAGLTAKKYKQLKGLRKENLRDNMTNEELVMNMLAELTTTNITKEEHPISMSEHAQAASRGGSVARVAREAFEQQTGKKVVTNLNMKRFLEKQQPQLDFSGDSEDKDK